MPLPQAAEAVVEAAETAERNQAEAVEAAAPLAHGMFPHGIMQHGDRKQNSVKAAKYQRVKE